MNTEILEYSNRYEVSVSDADGVWFTGTWGKETGMSPAQIKFEAELLADLNKTQATEQPTVVTVEDVPADADSI